jgi:glycosyltransferase involved in cell wall biosynthesis
VPIRHSANRLLLFPTDLHRGGTPTVVRELAIRLRDRGHPVEVACLDRMGVTGEELLAADIPVHALNAAGNLDLRIIHRTRALFRRGRYTRILSFLVHANSVAATVCRTGTFRSCRLFQSIQTTQPKPAWHWPVQRLAARSAERIIVPSLSVADFAKSRCGLKDRQVAIIPNAIDTGPFKRLQRDPARRLTRIGFLGRLDPVKRIPDLLAAASSIQESQPHLTFHVYGRGSERPSLESLAPNNVTFHGEVPSPLDALKELDVLVLPSQAEGFGLVLIEAMAAGIPVIASKAPGIVDVVTDNHTGLLYPTGDVAALAAAIVRLTSTPSLAATLANTALTHVAHHYDFDHVLQSYERVLHL